MEWQRERFRVHIRAARASGRPLVIHTRSASADTLRLIREEQGGEAGGVFHCFTETAEVARAALDLGFHISFSGILTFKNASDLRDVAAFVPLDRCLIETDSPYLAPMPFRGKVNTPANVPLVARQLAEIKSRADRGDRRSDVAQLRASLPEQCSTLLSVSLRNAATECSRSHLMIQRQAIDIIRRILGTGRWLTGSVSVSETARYRRAPAFRPRRARSYIGTPNRLPTGLRCNPTTKSRARKSRTRSR